MDPALFLGTFGVITVILSAKESELDEVNLERSPSHFGGLILMVRVP